MATIVGYRSHHRRRERLVKQKKRQPPRSAWPLPSGETCRPRGSTSLPPSLPLARFRHHPFFIRIDRSVSSVATMYQVGLFFHAGFVTLWVNASVEIGTCDMAKEPRPFSAGMSAAKSAAKCSCSIHQLLLLSGLNALVRCRACSIHAQLSPSSRANAAI